MRLIKILLVVLIIILLALGGGYAYWRHSLGEPIAIQENTIYEVPRGAGFTRIVSDLEQKKIIDNAWAYKLLAHVEPHRVKGFRAGEFELTPNMNAHALLGKLSSDDVVTYRLTIPEGWTFKQLRQELDQAEKLDHQTKDLTDTEVMEKLGHEDVFPEGQFFPDTYRYTKDELDTAILKRAYQRMQKTLDQVWTERSADLPYDSAYEALIMASLIERETGVEAERGEIAGVFVRRLEKGMRLQTDPTIIYGMGDRYKGRITYADLRESTPYNTYVIDGLPPTPIAMPGLAALQAAVNPTTGDSLYFVAKGDGSHQFSRTLQEHNSAVKRYILDKREAPVEAQPKAAN